MVSPIDCKPYSNGIALVSFSDPGELINGQITISEDPDLFVTSSDFKCAYYSFSQRRNLFCDTIMIKYGTRYCQTTLERIRQQAGFKDTFELKRKSEMLSFDFGELFGPG